MKVEFELNSKGVSTESGKIRIVGLPPNYKPYVSISLTSLNGVKLSGCIQDRDLERVAVNILKALKSNKLK